MADLLIKHLRNKGVEHSALGMLVSQWGFDEQLIPKALQSVGNLFPHYSRHDESHSRQILVNIERLLGDNIELLTATDTWLLLESAYWHDIGMVVPHDEIARTLKDPAFSSYLDGICNDPRHELQRFAVSLRKQEGMACFTGLNTPLDGVEQFRLLMAEWFRRQHPARAEQIVRAPVASVGISSPRTELIPARLFRTLGRICHMHGMSFDSLFELPFREAGMAQEDCHPRFIACLLRMGDLLDLDDNRFCPVMQRIAGDKRPRLTRAHEDKHAGIRHLRVDRERIEVTAECSTIEGYLETFKWFDWLKQEIQLQMANWQNIVPNRELGLLPTLGEISVRLAGELRVLHEGERPQFTVDGDQAIALLQGANLYSSPFSFVRELLQNAVDATCLRLWMTDQKKLTGEDWRSPFTPAARALLDSAPVEVELARTLSPVDAGTDESSWTLTITDRGTGISQEDLVHMMRIGGSQKNVARQAIINTMPEWLKPSGAFGIGFQSVFLLCDEVTLITKSIVTNETLQVTMYSPTGDKEGLVLLRRVENDISRPYGTMLQVPLRFETFAKDWYPSHPDNSVAHLVVKAMDPILDNEFPLFAAEMADHIRDFSAECLVPTHGYFSADAEPSEAIDLSPSEEISDRANKWHFVEANGYQVALALYFDEMLKDEYQIPPSLWFRGQKFEYDNLGLPIVEVHMNILSGRANSWLTANREGLASNAENLLTETLLAAVATLIDEQLEDIKDPDHGETDARTYSLLVEALALRFGDPWRELALKFAGRWMDLPAQGTNKTYREFLEGKSISILSAPASLETERRNSECDFVLRSDGQGTLTDIIINYWANNKANTVQLLELGTSKHSHQLFSHYSLKREPQPLYTPQALAERLINLTEAGHSGNLCYFLQCETRWTSLVLGSPPETLALPVFDMLRHNRTPVLLPFLFVSDRPYERRRKVTCEPKRLEALCHWVQPHLKTTAKIETIRKTYAEFIHYIDHEIMEPSMHWEHWKKARNL